MANSWEQLHPRYDSQIRRKMEIEALIEKLKQEKKNTGEEKSALTQDNDTDQIRVLTLAQMMIDSRIDFLGTETGYIAENLQTLDKQFSTLLPYETYALDLSSNWDYLKKREDLYRQAFMQVELSKQANGKETQDPEQWLLDTSAVEIEPLNTKADPFLFISRSPLVKGAKALKIRLPKKFVRARFAYADSVGGFDDGIIRVCG